MNVAWGTEARQHLARLTSRLATSYNLLQSGRLNLYNPGEGKCSGTSLPFVVFQVNH